MEINLGNQIGCWRIGGWSVGKNEERNYSKILWFSDEPEKLERLKWNEVWQKRNFSERIYGAKNCSHWFCNSLCLVLIDSISRFSGFELQVRLGKWDFISIKVHKLDQNPEFYHGIIVKIIDCHGRFVYSMASLPWTMPALSRQCMIMASLTRDLPWLGKRTALCCRKIFQLLCAKVSEWLIITWFVVAVLFPFNLFTSERQLQCAVTGNH